MFVQRLKDFDSYTPEGEPVLDTFGEAHQKWHLWRRRYEVFLRYGLTLLSRSPTIILIDMLTFHSTVETLPTASYPSRPKINQSPYRRKPPFHNLQASTKGFLHGLLNSEMRAGRK